MEDREAVEQREVLGERLAEADAGIDHDPRPLDAADIIVVAPYNAQKQLILDTLADAVLGLSSGAWIGGLIAGAIGAVIGTLGGAEVRGMLARSFGRDRPAALIEDAVAILLALWVVWAV